MKKKVISVLLAGAIAAGSGVNTFAAFAADAEDAGAVVISMRIGSPEMMLNGESAEIDPGMGTAPVIVNDRTLLPVRAVIEALGGTVGWDDDTRTVSLSYGENDIELTIDSTSAYLNGELQSLDSAPIIINDRTMLPIRFIAEGFGFEVEWEPDTQTVTITGAVDAAAPAETEVPAPTAEPTAEPTAVPTEDADSQNDREESRALVVYFSATGNTEAMAETIAEVTGADVFEIIAADPYTDEDLDYSNDDCRANREMNDENARPAIEGEIENIDEYDTIYLGYPIWWGTMPRIINTFLDTYDLSGKTVMPFCTSGSSGITTSVSAIREICEDADVKNGLRGTASESAAQIEEWIESNGIEIGG